MVGALDATTLIYSKERASIASTDTGETLGQSLLN